MSYQKRWLLVGLQQIEHSFYRMEVVAIENVPEMLIFQSKEHLHFVDSGGHEEVHNLMEQQPQPDRHRRMAGELEQTLSHLHLFQVRQ